jgi:hypothetical protein
MEYLSLPFVLREGYLDRVGLHESIMYSVGLILSTRPETLPFEPGFGWDKEFSDLYTANKAELRSSLRNAIDKYEKRLYDVTVSLVEVGEGAHETLGVGVKVNGNYRDNGEEKKFEATFHLG